MYRQFVTVIPNRKFLNSNLWEFAVRISVLVNNIQPNTNWIFDISILHIFDFGFIWMKVFQFITKEWLIGFNCTHTDFSMQESKTNLSMDQRTQQNLSFFNSNLNKVFNLIWCLLLLLLCILLLCERCDTRQKIRRKQK